MKNEEEVDHYETLGGRKIGRIFGIPEFGGKISHFIL